MLFEAQMPRQKHQVMGRLLLCSLGSVHSIFPCSVNITKPAVGQHLAQAIEVKAEIQPSGSEEIKKVVALVSQREALPRDADQINLLKSGTEWTGKFLAANLSDFRDHQITVTAKAYSNATDTSPTCVTSINLDRYGSRLEKAK